MEEMVVDNQKLTAEIVSCGGSWGCGEGIFDMIDQGKFKSTTFTDENFVGLESVPRALEALGRRGTWGKVVVKIMGDKGKL